MFSSRALVQLT